MKQALILLGKEILREVAKEIGKETLHKYSKKVYERLTAKAVTITMPNS